MGVKRTPGENNTGRRLRKAGMEDDRRARIAALKVAGLSIRQIHDRFEETGVINPDTGKAWSIGMIAEDLKIIDDKWKAEAMRDIGAWKKIELEKLEDIENKARWAWENGIGKKAKVLHEETTGGKDGGGTKDSTTTEDLNGDPRYLGILLDCQMRRAKLIGLDEALKTETTGKGGGPIEISDTERAAKLEELLVKVTQRVEEPKG